ncbi:MAG: lipoyl synthase [Deltaproteobacteria bacterium]|nr:lipoyl synthase [Deltaproteobacteria bacterium]
MNPNQSSCNPIKKPAWLRRRLPSGPDYENVRTLLKDSHLHTVCQEARCPNQWECFSARTATFLIMGSSCTRNCRFCAVEHGPVQPPDPREPLRIAEMVRQLGLTYVVITSVTRDDLSDGGARHFAEVIQAVRKGMPDAGIEVLIPDFQGDPDALKIVLDANPDVLNHNVETVPRLYPKVRPEAVYERSLLLIKRAGATGSRIQTKSGLMLGMGETPDEVRQVLKDLRHANCRILTLGQYLQPSSNQLSVERFIPPDEFDAWKIEALAMGFLQVASGPFVRSSYHAKELSTLPSRF